MKKLLFFLTLALFVLQAQAQTDWVKIKSDEHHFELDFYQDPITYTDTFELEGQNLYAHTWELDLEEGASHPNTYYLICKTEYPADFIHSDSVFELVDGFISSTQASLLEEKDFKLLSSTLDEKNGFPGKIFKWKNEENNVYFQYQVYLVNNILFELSLVVQEGHEHNKAIRKFFDSFSTRGISDGNFEIKNDAAAPTYFVNFTDEPTTQHRVIDSEAGKITLTIRMLEVKDKKSPNMMFMANETKYPTSINKEDTRTLNAFYKNAIDGALASTNGELISMEDIYYETYLGKEYKYYVGGGQAIVVSRAFLIEGTMYILGVFTQPGKEDNKEQKKFFNSFKLLK